MHHYDCIKLVTIIIIMIIGSPGARLADLPPALADPDGRQGSEEGGVDQTPGWGAYRQHCQWHNRPMGWQLTTGENAWCDENLFQVYLKLQDEHNIPAADFPDVDVMREKLKKYKCVFYQPLKCFFYEFLPGLTSASLRVTTKHWLPKWSKWYPRFPNHLDKYLK